MVEKRGFRRDEKESIKKGWKGGYMRDGNDGNINFNIKKIKAH